jgi:DNA mismatch repair ATPase MutS
MQSILPIIMASSTNKNEDGSGYISKIGKEFQPKKKSYSYDSLLYEGETIDISPQDYSAFGFDRFFSTVGFDVEKCDYQLAFSKIPLTTKTIQRRQGLLESLVSDDSIFESVSGLVESLVSIKISYEDPISKKVSDFQQFNDATTEYMNLDKNGSDEFEHLKKSLKNIQASDDYKKTLAFIDILKDNQIVQVVEREMDATIDSAQFPSYDGETRDISSKVAALRQRLDSVKFITDFFRGADLNQIHPDAKQVLDNNQVDRYFEKRFNDFVTPAMSRGRERDEYDEGDFYRESKRIFAAAYSFVQERLNAFLPAEINWNGFDDTLTAFTNLASFYRRIHNERVPLCFPEIQTKGKRTMEFDGLVNLLLYTKKEEDAELITPIAFSISEENPVAIITGPNTGGKTTLLEAVGHLQYSAQMGLMWPSRSGSASISDKVVFYKAGNNKPEIIEDVNNTELQPEYVLQQIIDNMAKQLGKHSDYEGRQILQRLEHEKKTILENLPEPKEPIKAPSDADGFYLSSLKRFYGEVLPQLSPSSILLIDEFGLGTNTNEVYERSNYIYDVARKSNVRVLHSTHLVELAHASIDGKINGAVSWGIETSKQGYSTFIPVKNTVGGSNGDRIAAEAGLSEENKKYIVSAIKEKGSNKNKLLSSMKRQQYHSGIDTK